MVPCRICCAPLWDAVETARGANDPATRETARTALGAAAGAFLEGTGVTEQLRQQMLEHVLGELDGGAAYAGKSFEELTRPEMARTKGGLAVLRGLAERGVPVAVHAARGKFLGGDRRRPARFSKAIGSFSHSRRNRASTRMGPRPRPPGSYGRPARLHRGQRRRHLKKRCSIAPSPTTTNMARSTACRGPIGRRCATGPREHTPRSTRRRCVRAQPTANNGKIRRHPKVVKSVGTYP